MKKLTERLKGKNVLFLDLEMNGNFQKGRKIEIIEVGACIIHGFNTENETLATYSKLFRPYSSISKYVERLTGITNKSVVGCPRFLDNIDEIAAMIDSTDIIVCHGGDLDRKALRQYGLLDNDKPVLDTVKVFRKKYPQEQKSCLSHVTEILSISYTGQHRALSDALATKNVLTKLLNNKENINEELKN